MWRIISSFLDLSTPACSGGLGLVPKDPPRAQRCLDEVIVGIYEPDVDRHVLWALADGVLKNGCAGASRGQVARRKRGKNTGGRVAIPRRCRAVAPAGKIEQSRRCDRGRQCIALRVRNRGVAEVPVGDGIARQVAHEEIRGSLCCLQEREISRQSERRRESVNGPRL